MSRTLDQLAHGQSATIVDVSGDDGISMRLMEMGLVEGEVVRRIGQAPMGDPIEFAIQGYRLTLRKVEAARVVIEQESHDA